MLCGFPGERLFRWLEILLYSRCEALSTPLYVQVKVQGRREERREERKETERKRVRE
jgi:hypothetical protein